MLYLPTFWLMFMVNVGKYTSPMDPMGVQLTLSNVSSHGGPFSTVRSLVNILGICDAEIFWEPFLLVS